MRIFFKFNLKNLSACNNSGRISFQIKTSKFSYSSRIYRKEICITSNNMPTLKLQNKQLFKYIYEGLYGTDLILTSFNDFLLNNFYRGFFRHTQNSYL